MHNVSITVKEAAIIAIEHFQEVSESRNFENDCVVPFSKIESFFANKNIDVNLFLSQTNETMNKFENCCFIEFWKFNEDLIKFFNSVNHLIDESDGILNGMVYLRNKIIEKSINNESSTEIKGKIIHLTDKPRNCVGVTIGQIHSIMLEIISNDICNDTSTAYWQDVLNQIPQDMDPNMFLELIDISNSIFQWLNEYLIKNELTRFCTTSVVPTRLATLNEEKNDWTKYCGEDSEFNKEKVETSKENKNHGVYNNKLMENVIYGSKEPVCESFESLPWKHQTMFSNFRELQISLQSILERVILCSSNGGEHQLNRKDELLVRKIYHMVTELEDYLYNQFDVRQEEVNRSEQIETENMKLKKQLKVAIEELDDFKVELQNSISQKGVFENEIKKISAQKSKLTSEIVHIKDENRSLEKKCQFLIHEYNELKERNEILTDENRQLMTELSEFKNSISVINSRNLEKNIGLLPTKVKDIGLKPNPNSKKDKISNNCNVEYTPVLNIEVFEGNRNLDNLNYEDGNNISAHIDSIPEFLESSVDVPISCQQYGKKTGYFTKKKIGQARLIGVVSQITKVDLNGFCTGKDYNDRSFIEENKSNR
ncbi:putative coiled-coil protein [Cryptosporidium felis]|nr:putative coiled-coil protein [Cryptosporidium felis]